MDIKEKEQFLIERGWHTYYNPNYWVHKKTVRDHTISDYTNYGFDLDGAYEYEFSGRIG